MPADDEFRARLRDVLARSGLSITALDRTSNQRMLMREGPTSRFRREGPGERGGCSGNSEG